MRIINQSSVREHALACSKQIRGGKFSRASDSFINEIQLEVESLVRSIQINYPSKTHSDIVFDKPEDKPRFVTGELLEKIKTVLDDAIARLIQRRVEQHPSCGTTLQGK